MSHGFGPQLLAQGVHSAPRHHIPARENHGSSAAVSSTRWLKTKNKCRHRPSANGITSFLPRGGAMTEPEASDESDSVQRQHPAIPFISRLTPRSVLAFWAARSSELPLFRNFLINKSAANTEYTIRSPRQSVSAAVNCDRHFCMTPTNTLSARRLNTPTKESPVLTASQKHHASKTKVITVLFCQPSSRH